MDGNSVEEPETSHWANFVKWLAAPAEAEMERLGITNKDEKNAFGHAYRSSDCSWLYGNANLPGEIRGCIRSREYSRTRQGRLTRHIWPPNRFSLVPGCHRAIASIK